MKKEYDLAVIGAGSGGLTAAGFAARLGAKVALIEKDRIGGDCTWTGCVPSKALLKAAKVAQACRTAGAYGVDAAFTVDMARVRDYVQRAVAATYQFETPEELQRQGIEVIFGAAQFADDRTVTAGEHKIRAKTFLIATGARPARPGVEGLDNVPCLTYENVFDNDRLPKRFLVAGGGPVGVELAQAYRRLGAEVAIVAPELLPKEEPEARRVIENAFEREGIRIIRGRVESARREGGDIVLHSAGEDVRGDLLLVACGRKPNVAGLGLENAGVEFSERGIAVDDRLRTNVKHIYAAGDVTGGPQFTHFAGWQAFQGARNALLPGHSAGHTDVVPWVTFTDPEIAHVGLTEAQARAKAGDGVKIWRWAMDRADRAICDGATDGFVKVVSGEDGAVLGATIVSARAGEAITELVLAMKHGWKLSELAGTIHPYPTYSTPVQQLAAEMAAEGVLSGASGRLLLGLSKLVR